MVRIQNVHQKYLFIASRLFLETWSDFCWFLFQTIKIQISNPSNPTPRKKWKKFEHTQGSNVKMWPMWQSQIFLSRAEQAFLDWSLEAELSRLFFWEIKTITNVSCIHFLFWKFMKYFEMLWNLLETDWRFSSFTSSWIR